MQLVFILVLLFAILVAIIAVQNTTPVTLRILAFELRDVAVSVLVLASMAGGAMLTAILGLGGRMRNVQAMRQRDQKIAHLEAELARERAARPAAEEPPAISASRPAGSSAEGLELPRGDGSSPSL